MLFICHELLFSTSMFCLFLARSYCMQYMIGYWHRMSSVCLSFSLWHCALWLNDTSHSKSVWTSVGSALVWTRRYNFQLYLHFQLPQTRHTSFSTQYDRLSQPIAGTFVFYFCDPNIGRFNCTYNCILRWLLIGKILCRDIPIYRSKDESFPSENTSL